MDPKQKKLRLEALDAVVQPEPVDEVPQLEEDKTARLRDWMQERLRKKPGFHIKTDFGREGTRG